MPKVKLNTIDPDDPEFKKEKDAVEVNIEAQRFDDNFSGLEVVEEVTQKTIAYLEKLIRKSYEYKSYVNYLKSELDITTCALIPSLDIKDVDISLEFHHYPINLYDIVDTILRKMLTDKKDDEKVNMFDVMEQTMKEHYDGHIGLVPLSKTMHEMAHSGSVKIPASSVYGNYMGFVDKYKEYMTPELVEKVKDAAAVTKEECVEFNKKLEVNVLKYNVKYNEYNPADNNEED